MKTLIITPTEWEKAFPSELTSLLPIEDLTTVSTLQLKAYTKGITKEEIGTLIEILDMNK